MNHVTTIAEVLQATIGQFVDREYRRAAVRDAAVRIDEQIHQSQLITTVEQLRAIRGGHELAGPIIKALGATGMGEIYEQNTDGTWGILCTPGTTGSWDERALDPQDIALPALLLWTPA